MPRMKANGIEVEYDTFGNRSLPALLLIAGIGAQMIVWEDAFCRLLAESGFFVIRFDNRDSGLSTKFEGAGIPDFLTTIQAAREGRPVETPYTLEDMADDAVGLLGALGIEQAHICGMSMGGMIAQVLACRHPKRALSLTSIMSTTGNPKLPQAKPETIATVAAPPPEEREAFIEHNVNIWRKIWSPGFPFEEERVRTFIRQSYDRSYYPQGMARQNTAILASGDRRSSLSSLDVPTLVIHGADDPLIPVDGGKNTAHVIPGAGLLIIDGMGHDIPASIWGKIVNTISHHAMQTGD